MNDLITKTCAGRGWALEGDRITVPLGSGRSQAVTLEPYEAKGLRFLRLYSRLGPAANVDALRLRASLRLNWTLPYGAVAIASVGEEGEFLVLCDSVLVDTATEERLGMAVEFLAGTADEYEKFVFGTDDN